MIKHKGRIVQLGFGAVGRSFFEKVKKEIKFDEYQYFVVTKNKAEYEAYINLGGISSNFSIEDINRENYKELFSKYLREGDLLIDFIDNVGTREFVEWCAEHNVMYINTGETDWAEIWYSIFEEHDKKALLQEKYRKEKGKNKYPIVVHHGNNPGLVSHFVKAGIDYIISSQFKKDKHLKSLSKEGRYNEIAKEIGIKMIHVNDIDNQKIKGEFDENVLISPWCVDSYWCEMLSEATFDVGTHEIIDYEDETRVYEKEKGYLEFQKYAVDKVYNTYYPHGQFGGHMVPHEETVSIANSLTVKENGKVVYRPSVMFLYSPCEYASKFLKQAKGKEVKDPKDNVRGYAFPEKWEILYAEKIESGVEYVGVLILGDKFDPVWVGNRVETSFLAKDKKTSYWQTPTITPVAMSALAGVCWMLKNKDKGGIYFPDDIKEYQDIIKTAEKYISKTIYKTFSRKEIEDSLKIDLKNPQTKDLEKKYKKGERQWELFL